VEITVRYYPASAACEWQERKLVLQETATIQDLLKSLGVSPAEATAIFRNDKSALCQEILSQGDVVTVMSFVSGG
jgi:sulfur carrier protein ThiS